MKRVYIIILATVLSMTMISCGSTGTDGGENVPPYDAEYNYSGELFEVDETSMLVAVDDGSGEAGTLCRVDIAQAAAAGASGNIGDAPAGARVQFQSDGNILETYPSQMTATAVKIAEQGNGLPTLYLAVLTALYEEDAALNDDIDTIAFDLGGASNLTEGEKEAIGYLVSGAYGKQCVYGTFDELAKDGYIDEENLYFPTGVLLSVTVDEDSMTDTKFEFDSEKWRGGLGAIFYTDCTATSRAGVWSYKPGEMAIA